MDKKNPDNFSTVVRAEFDDIKKRREAYAIETTNLDRVKQEIEKAASPAEILKHGPAAGLVGIALSGGGIRSAVFNLGLLQALGRRGALRICDYLSTVSGGGYIGSCLSAILSYSGHVSWAKGFPFFYDRKSESDENAILKHLRTNANYLMPDGIADIFKMGGTFFSGMFLMNATPLVLMILIAWGIHAVADGHDSAWMAALSLKVLFCAIASFSMMIMIRAYYSMNPGKEPPLAKRKKFEAAYGIFLFIALLLTGVSGVMALAAFLPILHTWVFNYLHGITVAALLGLIAGCIKASDRTINKIIKAVFRVAWILILPLLGSEILYLCMITHIFAIDTIWHVPLVLIIAAGLLLPAFFANTNRLTLHSHYRDRLSETFIDIARTVIDESKSAPNRHPDRLKMSQVNNRFRGPYHIVNTTMNIPGSSNPEFKGRKGVNFIFTRRYCGSEATGYKKTNEYYSDKNTLTTAMAISGGAASPQMGMHTNPFLRALLMFLNVRLNRWLPNPLYSGRIRRFPVRPYYLFKELLGLENEKDWHINLSDGGHLENGGIYPLVMRGCRYIIASDAGEDPDFLMKDLAVSLRKIRIDFGVDIDIDLRGVMPIKGNTKFTPLHYAVGTISYPDPALQGYFVYLNSTLCENEPEDVLSYGRTHPTFPDESTADQFFDEAQYESYRKLGELTGRQAFPEDGVVANRAYSLPVDQSQPPSLLAKDIEDYFKGLLKTYKEELEKRFP